MDRRIIKQGEATSFAFYHVGLGNGGDTVYRINDSDKLTFSIGRRNRSPTLIKVFPDGFERVDDTYFVFLTADETARLPCLLYQMQLTVDIRGKGKEVYTISDMELEVRAK